MMLCYLRFRVVVCLDVDNAEKNIKRYEITKLRTQGSQLNKTNFKKITKVVDRTPFSVVGGCSEKGLSVVVHNHSPTFSMIWKVLALFQTHTILFFD